MPDALFRTLPGLLGSFLLLLLLPALAQGEEEQWYRVEMLVFSNSGGGDAEVWEATPTLAYPRESRMLLEPDHPAVASLQQEPGALPLSPVPAVRGLDSPAPFITLPDSDLEFRGAAARMQRDGRYQKLFHKAWTQPIPGRNAAIPIVLDRSGDGGPWPALQGSVKLYISRYIYLETNLWLNTRGDYLHSAWRMPPPPLGPPTVMPAGIPAPVDPAPMPGPATQPSMAHDQGMHSPAPESLPAEDTPGPEYPYAHAVLLDQTRRMRSGEVNYIDHPLFGVVVKVTPIRRPEPEPQPQPDTEPG